MARFYMAIVQAVLLYGADSWALSAADNLKLDRFHKRAVRHMMGCHIQKDSQDNWSYQTMRYFCRNVACSLLVFTWLAVGVLCGSTWNENDGICWRK